MGKRPGAPAAPPLARVTGTGSPSIGPARAHLDDPPPALREQRPARGAAAARPGRSDRSGRPASPSGHRHRPPASAAPPGGSRPP
ncbi:hypothetical protein [Kitasatospora sp. NPDC006786]|uniref:hypothetical protein n=1 Tax=unclassified Kitasatospora TaxID=2633591 RepID=UPI0033DBB130